MKAAWYEKNGGARDVLQVGEVAKPEPEAGEVRVRLMASGVNPSDVKARDKRPLGADRIIPHSDGAGEIEAVGKGVPHARIGERVWVFNAQWRRPFGTAAEYVCLPTAQAVKLPASVDYAVGACIGIPLLTAIHAVTLQGDVGGRTLLVTGAGSAVGHYVTQIAKLRGARIIGTASAARASHARNAGADFVVDYKTKDVARTVKDLTSGKGVDGIIDMDFFSTAGIIAQGALAPHGKIVCYGSNFAGDVPVSFPTLLWNSLSLQVFLVYDLQPRGRAEAIRDITKLLEQNKLRHTIANRYALKEIAVAHEAVEKGVQGNVILDFG